MAQPSTASIQPKRTRYERSEEVGTNEMIYHWIPLNYFTLCCESKDEIKIQKNPQKDMVFEQFMRTLIGNNSDFFSIYWLNRFAAGEYPPFLPPGRTSRGWRHTVWKWSQWNVVSEPRQPLFWRRYIDIWFVVRPSNTEAVFGPACVFFNVFFLVYDWFVWAFCLFCSV